MYNNPVIKGFNPDPSICFAEGRYHLAVSTFEYFPGVTIYSSDNLVDWEYEASSLGSIELLDLRGADPSTGGIYAPTLRYRDGMYYMVTTLKKTDMNFMVRARNIKGPWYGPINIRVGGIDPSLFFDDDGSCFYTSNGEIDGVKGIIGGYIDIDTGKFLTGPEIITEGISKHSTEAPHIYKRNGYYYLIFAEGGTGMGHHEEVLRSVSLEGPWEYRGAPILTHTARKDHPIQATGHADLIETPDGNWAAVFLGIRKPLKQMLHQLGRETFLAPVEWIDDWPVIGKNGHVETVMEGFTGKQEKNRIRLDFHYPLSGKPILFLRECKQDRYIQNTDEGTLTLVGDDPINTPNGSPTMLMLRQTDFDSHAVCRLKTSDLEGTAGIVAWYSDLYYYALSARKEDKRTRITLFYMVHGFLAKAGETTTDRDEIELTVKTSVDRYSFYVGTEFLGSASHAGLSTEAMMRMSFTGTLIGIFSEKGRAVFERSFEYIED